jgi:mRNA interferase RelE/StbE
LNPGAKSEPGRPSHSNASWKRSERLGFRVEFSELAAEEFEKLDKPIRERIARKLRTMAVHPAHYLTRLSSVDAYKLRVGDYRVIVDVEWKQKIVYVLSVGHRSTVYRR